MSEIVIVSIISLLGTLGGSLLGVLSANKLMTYRINELEKKVEKHNNIIERVYKLEKADAVEAEEIKVINHRIDDLEKFHTPKTN
jgi:hypothetical protein